MKGFALASNGDSLLISSNLMLRRELRFSERNRRTLSLPIGDDVIQLLAVNLKNNIRELEGALIRLKAHSSFTGESITANVAKDILKDVLGTERKVITQEHVQEAVANRFRVKVSDLKSKRRTKTLVHPRQIAMYLSRELTDASFPEIGQAYGGKDHTTIIHACKQVDKALRVDQELQKIIESLKGEITKGVREEHRSMKISIARTDLLTALQRVQGVVEKRNTMPILANILLEGKAEGLDIIATDLEIGMRGLYKATIDEPGAVTFSARKLFEILKEIKEHDVTLIVKENNIITIQAGRSQFKVVGLPSQDFPALPAIEREGLIPLPGSGLLTTDSKNHFCCRR